MSSTALHTDQYELTMLDAALLAGAEGQRVTFEVFPRRIPPGRRYGVFAGLERVLDAIDEFRFAPDTVDWLRSRRIVSEETLAWLERFRFSGDIHAYREGEFYTAGSPVMTVEGRSGSRCCSRPSSCRSSTNHDSSVAAAASLIVEASGGRPVIEMGSRRTDSEAAVAAARAGYLAGLASTSNLEAGKR